AAPVAATPRLPQLPALEPVAPVDGGVLQQAAHERRDLQQRRGPRPERSDRLDLELSPARRGTWCRRLARRGRRRGWRQAHFDLLQLDGRGRLSAEGVEDIRPAHLALRLDAQGLQVLAEETEIAVARGEGRAELGNGALIPGQAKGGGQDEGDHHEQDDAGAYTSHDQQATR